MFELHSVERACARVPGGLKSIKLIDPNDLETKPAWNVSASAGSLDFLPGKAAYTLEPDKLVARLECETIITSAAGDFNEYRLTAGIRAIRPTVESLIAKLMNRRVHVVVTYRDDLQRFLPYMRLSSRNDSGNVYTDKQGYNFTGVTRLIMPGPGVGGNIAEVAPPVTDGGTDTTGAVTVTETTTTEPIYTTLIPAGKWLLGWEIRSDEDQTVSAGLTSGGNELDGPVDVAALQWWIGQGNDMPTSTSYNIYFSGLTGTNTIKIWLAG